MKYVLFYESTEDVAKKAPTHQAAHNAYWHPFRERGTTPSWSTASSARGRCASGTRPLTLRDAAI
jgi:hypothetical protein